MKTCCLAPESKIARWAEEDDLLQCAGKATGDGETLQLPHLPYRKGLRMARGYAGTMALSTFPVPATRFHSCPTPKPLLLCGLYGSREGT